MENVDVETREIQMRRVANGIIVEPLVPPSQRGMITSANDVFVFNSFEELIIWLRGNMVLEKARLEKQNGQR